MRSVREALKTVYHCGIPRYQSYTRHPAEYYPYQAPSARYLHNVPPTSAQEQGDGNRGFYLDVLAANPTKREARAYLTGFEPPKRVQPEDTRILPNGRHNVNLGKLYRPLGSELPTEQRHRIQVALTVIRDPENLDRDRLQKVAGTLSRLSRLGLKCIVVLDTVSQANESVLIQNFVEIIESSRFHRARNLSGVFRSETTSTNEPKISCSRDHLDRALARDIIPIIACKTWDVKSALLRQISADTAALAIIESFVADHTLRDESHSSADFTHKGPDFVLQRLIILDSHGAIPSIDDFGQHVFVNLAQEYNELKSGLLSEHLKDITSAKAHLQNLELSKQALNILPDSASAIISTPHAAGRTAMTTQSPGLFTGVGTRSLRNPLVHNLLTDKPLFSSSLPWRRRLETEDSHEGCPAPSMRGLSSTLLKRGMPLRIIPDPNESGWAYNMHEETVPTLQDPRIDLDRLIKLIEDSFGRKLSVDAYLKRIDPIIAGIIIAGDYEGGAILTWEPVPGKPNASHVPYLDKLAVLKRSQGVGGVADILFNAMVRTCFPKGVCWRSRAENPINKWYFERSNGAWKLPQSYQPEQGRRESAQAWTMFWTDQDIQPDRWHEYAAVCNSIMPTWAK